jgi:hypothetical protein
MREHPKQDSFCMVFFAENNENFFSVDVHSLQNFTAPSVPLTIRRVCVFRPWRMARTISPLKITPRSFMLTPSAIQLLRHPLGLQWVSDNLAAGRQPATAHGRINQRDTAYANAVVWVSHKSPRRWRRSRHSILAKPVTAANALIAAYSDTGPLNLASGRIHALKPEASSQAVLAFVLASNSALLDLHCRRRYGDKRRFALRDIIRVVFFHPIHRIQPSRKMTASRNSQADTAARYRNHPDHLSQYLASDVTPRYQPGEILAAQPEAFSSKLRCAVLLTFIQPALDLFAVPAQRLSVIQKRLGNSPFFSMRSIVLIDTGTTASSSFLPNAPFIVTSLFQCGARAAVVIT